MPPSLDTPDSLNNSTEGEQSATTANRRIFRFDNFHINRHLNSNGTRFSSLESNGSTVSNEDNQSLSTSQSAYQYGPKWNVSESKKYSLKYVPKADIQKLVTEFDSIIDKVEERQHRAAIRTHKSTHPHWNLISDVVEKKHMINKPYLNMMYPDMAQFKEAAGTFEDQIIRKQVYAAGKKPASHREWRILYAVLKNNTLSFYKDINYRRSEITYHGEMPLLIDGGASAIETSSKKRRYLIRLKLSDGSEFILQCQSIDQWARFLAELNTTIKRYTPHTTVTTPFGSSFPNSPFKSNASTEPSTPLSSKHIILTVKETDIHENPTIETEVHQPTSDAELQSTIEAEVHQPQSEMSNLAPVVNGIVENPNPQVLTAGLANNHTNQDDIDSNNNDNCTLVLDDEAANDSML